MSKDRFAPPILIAAWLLTRRSDIEHPETKTGTPMTNFPRRGLSRKQLAAAVLFCLASLPCLAA